MRKLLMRKTRELLNAARGNVSIIFALCLIPLVGIVGLGVDYGIGLTDKSRLDHAADAAAIAAVAAAKAYVAANPNDPSVSANAIAAGQTQAAAAFAVNAGSVPFATVATPSINLSATGPTFTSKVSYTATTQNHFGQIFNVPLFNLSGTSGATASVPQYLDFYLLVDVSGSMGLPSTTIGESQLASVNRDGYPDFQQGCMFACHYPGMTGWTLATTYLPGPIQLRSGAVNSAVCALLQQAAQPMVPNEYRVGIYPFINNMAALTATGPVAVSSPGTGLASGASGISNLSTISQCALSNPMTFTNLLDTGNYSGPMGAGGTHFDTVMQTMQSTILNYGDGSTPLKSKPFVFLVTDGMQNNMTFNGGFSGSQPAAIDPTVCNALKRAGAMVSVLYIPYLIINFVPNGGINSTESTKVNAISPTLQTPLSQCASPGYFYTANSPADITAALTAMFNQAVQVAHLTQ